MDEEAAASQPEETPDQPGSAGSEMSAMIDQLESGERWIALGAAVIVLDYVVFELLLGEYTFFTGTLLVAAYGLFAIWVRQRRSPVEWPISHSWMMRVLGGTAAFLGLIELLTDLRFDLLDDVGDILGALLLYAGTFLMFWGARQMQDTAAG